MAEVKLARDIDAPVAQVWASWDRFGAIDMFNPNLRKSFLINGSQETGLGAERQCDLADGKNFIQERIVEYIPERRMTVDIYNGTMPLKQAVAKIELTPLSPTRTRVEFTMSFTPKMGLLGRIMVPMMKPQFARLLGKLMDGNKAFVERGETAAA